MVSKPTPNTALVACKPFLNCVVLALSNWQKQYFLWRIYNSCSYPLFSASQYIWPTHKKSPSSFNKPHFSKGYWSAHVQPSNHVIITKAFPIKILLLPYPYYSESFPVGERNPPNRFVTLIGKNSMSLFFIWHPNISSSDPILQLKRLSTHRSSFLYQKTNISLF
jgi:hypothetical protein